AHPPGRGSACPQPARSHRETLLQTRRRECSIWQGGPMTQLDRLLRAEAWDEVRRQLVAMRPFDVAEELTRLGGTDRALAFRLLPKDLAVGVFEALDPPVQGALLEGLRDESVRMFV